VQVAVSRLRSLLDPGRTGPSAVRTSLAGYQLSTDRDAVDVWVFERAADEALLGTSPAARLALCDRALDLWAGDPYADCAAPLVSAEAARLEELHLGLHGARAGAMVRLGRPDAAVRMLAHVVPGQPYREDLWALLARAQYACDRQADALATLATLRARLAADLGVDPSPRTRALEEQVLRQDAALVAGSRPSPHPEIRHARPHQRARVGRCTASSVTPRSRVAV
jgi:DNA-binding SARP family transcriptional activator